MTPFVFINDTATTDIYTLSLHDALPISNGSGLARCGAIRASVSFSRLASRTSPIRPWARYRSPRSEEHTSELQSRQYLVCRLLLEKKKQKRRLDAAMGAKYIASP